MAVHHNDRPSQQAASTNPAVRRRYLMNLRSQPTLAVLVGTRTPQTVLSEHFSIQTHQKRQNILLILQKNKNKQVQPLCPTEWPSEQTLVSWPG